MKRIIASVLSSFMVLSTFTNLAYANDRQREVTETKTFPQVQSYTTEKSGYWYLGNNSRF